MIKEETKSRRVQLLIRPSLYYQLEKEAKAEQRSLNDYINIILEDLLIGDIPEQAEMLDNDVLDCDKAISNKPEKTAIANFLLFGQYGYGKNMEIAERFAISNDELLTKAIRCSNKGYHHVKGQTAIMSTSALRSAIFEALAAGKDENIIRQFCYTANTGYLVASAYYPAKNLRKYIKSFGAKKDLDVKKEKYAAALMAIDETISAVNGDSHV